jgi:hypothetical protein
MHAFLLRVGCGGKIEEPARGTLAGASDHGPLDDVAASPDDCLQELHWL